MTVKETFGRYGEDLAVESLLALGYVLEERNWRCPQGELDVVAWDGDVLVFVEVKTRSSGAFGTAAEAVTPEKLLRMRRAMAQWLLTRRPPFAHLRIDVVTVTTSRDAAPVLEHLIGVG
ncbi:MAG: putative endonuclease [Frankiaceae bacterium]|nr:putative endonuclease [Frankiaceae bacterium]MDQ1726361.1 putative endonuclease [Frankiaceae bacterium]